MFRATGGNESQNKILRPTKAGSLPMYGIPSNGPTLIGREWEWVTCQRSVMCLATSRFTMEKVLCLVPLGVMRAKMR